VNKKADLEEKTERIVDMLSENDLGGVLLNSQHNFSWLTGGATNGIDLSREAGDGTLLIRDDGKRFVLANRIEMSRLLKEEIAEEEFEPVEFGWEDERGSPTLIPDRARALLKGKTALGSDLSLGQGVLTVEGAVTRCRYQLTPSEIARFRSLGRDAGDAIGELMRTLEPGLAETEIGRKATHALASRGAHAVVVLVAADDRLRTFRHPVPKERRWEKVLMVVVCARREGLIVSLSRIICAGPVPTELKRRTEACARVDARLLAATRPGVSGTHLYNLAAGAYASEGFEGEERLHHQGGACGYRTRDWLAFPSCEERVQANQAFAWNPSITGTKVEETSITFEENSEVITASPAWPSISVTFEGQEFSLPDVLSV